MWFLSPWYRTNPQSSFCIVIVLVQAFFTLICSGKSSCYTSISSHHLLSFIQEVKWFLSLHYLKPTVASWLQIKSKLVITVYRIIHGLASAHCFSLITPKSFLLILYALITLNTSVVGQGIPGSYSSDLNQWINIISTTWRLEWGWFFKQKLGDAITEKDSDFSPTWNVFGHTGSIT